MILNLIGFLFCALLVIISGMRLSFHGDRIAELTGIGKAWVGLIMMALVTSIPELITGISSVVIVNQPDFAAGDVFGSCVFNLLILSLVDVRIKKPLTCLVKPSHIVAGLFSILLLTICAVAIIIKDKGNGWFSYFTPVIILVYLIAIRSIFKYEKKNEFSHISVTEIKEYENKGELLKRSILIYGFNAIIVIIAALFLPYFGEHIANHFGFQHSFFGTLFLAATTSLPELVVSFAAIRLQSYDMMMGNLLGSNLFNILILGIDDLFYTNDSLFSNISQSHLVSVIATIAMTTITGIGLMVKREKKIWKFSIDAILIFIIYILLIVYLFFSG